MKILASVLGGMVAGLIIGFLMGSTCVVTITPVRQPQKTFTGVPLPVFSDVPLVRSNK